MRATAWSSCPTCPRTPPDALVRRGLAYRHRPRRRRSLLMARSEIQPSCQGATASFDPAKVTGPPVSGWQRRGDLSRDPSEATARSVPGWRRGDLSRDPSEATARSVPGWRRGDLSRDPSEATARSVPGWRRTAPSGHPSEATAQPVSCRRLLVSWSPADCWKPSGAPGRLGWSRPSRNGTPPAHYVAPRRKRAGRIPSKRPAQPQAPLRP
jgi:hypothetical protein